MARAKLTPEEIQKIVSLRAQGLSMRAIGVQMGIHNTTVVRALKRHGDFPRQDKGGEAPPPSRELGDVIDRSDIDGSVEVTRLDKPFTVDELRKMAGLDSRLWIARWMKANVWQGHYKLSDAKGGGSRKVNLFQTKATFQRVVEEEVEEAIYAFAQDAVKPLSGGRLKPTRKTEGEPHLVSWGLWDCHIGSYAWSDEVGADFDLTIAENRVMNSIDDMVRELGLYNIGRILMPIGNDFLHFDSVRMTTTLGDHHLDTDTRYSKVFLTGLRCLCYMIERALEICDDIELIYVPGNHDYTSSFALCACLAQRFLNDPRVRPDLGANPRKYRNHGGVILGYEHGQKLRKDRMPVVMARECKEWWATSSYCEIQIGHTHQRAGMQYAATTPTNGVLVRTNPALCNVDSWHHAQGFIGESMPSVEAYRYDTIGFRGSHVTWARDDENHRRGTIPTV